MHKPRFLSAAALVLMLPFSAAAEGGTLTKAAATCDVTAVSAALAAGASPNTDSGSGTPLSLTATRAITLNHAAASADDPCLQSLQLMLDAGGNPALPARTGDEAPLLHTALSLATMYQRYAAFALLADNAGEAINQQAGDTKETPLIAAVRYRDAPLVRILLQHGADPHAKDAAGNTALSIATAGGDSGRMAALEAVGITRTAEVNNAILALLKGARQ